MSEGEGRRERVWREGGLVEREVVCSHLKREDVVENQDGHDV